jgi:hypothetical protein
MGKSTNPKIKEKQTQIQKILGKIKPCSVTKFLITMEISEDPKLQTPRGVKQDFLF